MDDIHNRSMLFSQSSVFSSSFVDHGNNSSFEVSSVHDRATSATAAAAAVKTDVKKINISSEHSKASHLLEVGSGADLYLKFVLVDHIGGDTSPVLVFNVRCLAYNSVSKSSTDHAMLQLFLLGVDGNVIFNHTYYCRGEYSLTVPFATAGLRTGSTYSLLIRNLGPSSLANNQSASSSSTADLRQKLLRGSSSGVGSSDSISSQRVSVQARVVAECASSSLLPDTATRGSVAEGGYSYFKITIGPENMHKLVRITAKALNPLSGADTNTTALAPLPSLQFMRDEYNDIDICTTNRHGGLMACTLAENCSLWRSCNSRSPECIDIHPEDAHRGQGSVFLIGVYGYRSSIVDSVFDVDNQRRNVSSHGIKSEIQFELQVSLIDLNPIKVITPPPVDAPISISTQCRALDYTYFSINFSDLIKSRRSGGSSGSSSSSSSSSTSRNSMQQHLSSSSQQGVVKGKLDRIDGIPAQIKPLSTIPNRIVVKISDDPSFPLHFNPNSSKFIRPSSANLSPQVAFSYDKHALMDHGIPKDTFSRGVYCSDDFDYHVFDTHIPSSDENVADINTATATASSVKSNQATDMVIPVLYISTSCMYPSATNFMWRASPLCDAVSKQQQQSYLNTGFLFDIDELLDLSTSNEPIENVYFSIYGHSVTMNRGGVNGSSGGSFGLNSNVLSFDEGVGGLNSSLLNGQRNDKIKKVSVSIWSHCINTPPKSNYTSINMQVKNNLEMFNALFSAIDGFKLSRQDRNNSSNSGSNDNQHHHHLDNSSPAFIYGEVEFSSFGFLLQWLSTSLSIPTNAVFCDVGCGVGKAIATAALADVRFVKCIGVELLPSLASAAREAMDRLTQCISSSNWTSFAELEIRQGDALSTPWIDADVVFFSSVCFEDDVLRSLFTIATNLKGGSKILSFKAPSYLTSPDGNDTFELYFKRIAHFPCKFSWGFSTVMIFERVG